MSVTQDRACEKCLEVKPLTLEYFKETGSGALRRKCRNCEQIEDRERWHARRSDGLLALVPEHAERFYDRSRNFYDLTAMHRASGEGRNKNPYEWLRLASTAEFIEALVAELNTDKSRILPDPDKGRGSRTLAHWQVAIAYAKYLSPSFHIQWNEYAAAYLRSGQQETAIIPAQPSHLAEHSVALVRIETKVDALQDRVDSIGRRLDQITTMTELVICTGFVYVAVFSPMLPFRVQDAEAMFSKGYVLIAIGETTKPANKRVEEYVGKLPIEPPRLIKVIGTDDQKRAEQLIHERCPRDVRPARPANGAPQSRFRDLFWARPDHLELLVQLPNQVTVDVLDRRLTGWQMAQPQVVPLRLWEGEA